MRLGSLEWAEIDDVGYPTPTPPVESIIVAADWPWVKECLKVRPEWFTPLWPGENLDVYFTPLSIYRAAAIFDKLGSYAELKIHEFIERCIAGTQTDQSQKS